MDGTSPIEALLTGRLREDEFLAAVDRVLVDGTQSDQTLLLNDWRTKSGRIRDATLRGMLDTRMHPLRWAMEKARDAPEPKPLSPGDVLAERFVIEARLGSGGMGVVFRARDLRREEAQDRQPYVAVKTLNMDVLEREDSLKILQREARKAQSLAHPNIVRVYDFDRDGGTLFLTMELLEGTQLEQTIQQNGLRGAPPSEVLPILRQVASALQFAHGEGIIHSDLKPANIIVLPNGRVKVIDFGISRAMPNPNQLTRERTTFDVRALGALTPAYASPEMIEGLEPDPRDDVFALACIAYEMLTGRHPFGRTPASVARVGKFAPQPPPGLAPVQWRALQAGMHFERSERTASAEQLVAGLAKATPTLLRRWPIAVGALGVVVAVGLGAYFIQPGKVTAPPPLTVTDQAAEQAARQKVADEAARDAARRRATEDAAQRAAQQKVADEAARQAAQQKAAEEAAQRAAQQKAADEAAQRAAQQRVAEEAAQQRAADEAVQQAARQKAAEDAAQRAAQQRPTEQAIAPPADQIGPTQIAEAQRLLTALGLGPGATDGKLGPRTQEMLRAFQLATDRPATGELTTPLLESLRHADLTAAAKSRSLFRLAGTARQAGRSADAIRLYEAGLKFAANDPDALLALGDLYRDTAVLDTARRYYETLGQRGGAAADTARARLASLPSPQAATAAPPASVALAPPPLSPAAGTGAGDQDIASLKQARQCSTTFALNIGNSGRSTISQTDDGWCWLSLYTIFGGRLMAPHFRVATSPAHGTLLMGEVANRTRVAYRPTPGFRGEDAFEIVDRTNGFVRSVSVAVVP